MRDENEARMDRAQDSLYDVEHFGAWVMAVVAIVLGVLGALTGFGIINLREAATTIDLPGVTTDVEAATIFSNNFWDATLLLFSGISAALLAFCLHSSDHHRMRDLSTMRSSERGLWGAEHTMAYIMALVTIVLIALGLLVGFGVFSATHDQFDGLIWTWLSVGSAVLTTTLHMVRHHQMSVEEDYIIGIIDERVGRTTTGPTTTQPGRTNIR
jgi:hypothetical protein